MSDGSSKYQIVLTASDKTREAFDSVKNNTTSLREDLNVLGGAFGAVAGVAATAIAVMVKNSIDVADATSKAAQKVGMTTEAFSALQYAADLSDVSSESLQKNLAKLASNAYIAATAGGETAATFKKLGVDVKNADGSLKDSGVLLSELSAKFAGMPDSAEKSALAIKLFGKSGMEMIPMLNSGADGLKEMGDEAQRFGLIIDGEAAKQAEAFNDNLTRLKKASEGFSNEIMSHLLPGLTKTTEAMVELSQEGHPVLAMLRGFAGAGQAFWDFLIPPENLKKALAPDGMLDEATKQLKKLQHEKDSIEGSGFGLINTDKIDREITILQNQIATIKNHRAELAQPPKTDKPVSTAGGGLDNEEAKKSMDAMLANAQKFADELVVSHQSAFDKIVTKYVEMDEKLSKAGAAGAETRKQVHRSFEAFMVDEQQKRTEAIQAAADKETEANNKLIETQQEKFARMREIADQASATGEERENARYEAQMRTLENEKQVLEDKHLWSLESEAKYLAAKEALQKEHIARSSQVSRTYGVSLVQFEAQTAMQRTQTMAAGLAQMTAVGAQKHRALFEINKVAGIANAVIHGIEAVQSSYKFGASFFGGPAGGYAMAAIAMAATAANVEAIRSTEFGGGAPNVGGGGVPSMAVSPGVPVAPQPAQPVEGVEAQATRQVNIHMSGEANMFTAKAIREQLIPALNEAAGDGVLINIVKV